MAFTSYPNHAELPRVPGLLFWNPTAFDTEANWGTKIGYTTDGVEINVGADYEPLFREEDGPQASEMLYLGAYPVIVATLRNWNEQLLKRLYPGINNISTGRYEIHVPGAYLPGKRLSTISGHISRLLFVPDDRTNNNVVLLQKAVPSAVGSFKYQRSARTVFQAVFHGFPNTATDSDSQLYIGKIGNAALR